MPGLTNSSAALAAARFWRSVAAVAVMACRIPFAPLGPRGRLKGRAQGVREPCGTGLEKPVVALGRGERPSPERDVALAAADNEGKCRPHPQDAGKGAPHLRRFDHVLEEYAGPSWAR